MNNIPESELPWEEVPLEYDWDLDRDFIADKDRNYIIHCCNSYPKLIEIIKDLMWESETGKAVPDAQKLLKELGEWNQ
jgi:hypothetical protein